MTSRFGVLAFIALLSVATIEACRKAPEPAPVPVVVANPDDGAAARRRADSIAAATVAQRRADSIAAAARNTRPNTSTDALTQTALLSALTRQVYFDYDKDDLRDDTKAMLDEKAAILIANAGVTLVITGHTDERGTAEYNLALGQRRAAQVRRFLATRGVAESRLTPQSLGDSSPASSGTDDAAYQLNRRAEFETTNADALVRPKS